MSRRSDEMEERFIQQRRSRRITTVLGLAAIAAGYMLLAVPPGTSQEWVLARVALGLLLVIFGFWSAVLPLLGSLFGTDYNE